MGFFVCVDKPLCLNESVMLPIILLIALSEVPADGINGASRITFVPGDACFASRLIEPLTLRPGQPFLLESHSPPFPEFQPVMPGTLGIASLEITEPSNSFCENWGTAVKNVRTIHPRWIKLSANDSEEARARIERGSFVEVDPIFVFIINRDSRLEVNCPFYRYNESWKEVLKKQYSLRDPHIRQFLPDLSSESESRAAQVAPLAIKSLAGDRASLATSKHIAAVMLSKSDLQLLWDRFLERPGAEERESQVRICVVTDDAIADYTYVDGFVSVEWRDDDWVRKDNGESPP